MTMSSPSSPEYLADIRDGARRMVERTRTHQNQLNDLVNTADDVAHRAAALSAAFARPDIDAGELYRLCSD
jgi:hypothetical protein